MPRFLLSLIRSLGQGIDSKAKIASVEAHGGNDSSSFVQPMSHDDNSPTADTESEFETGRKGHLRRASF